MKKASLILLLCLIFFITFKKEEQPQKIILPNTIKVEITGGVVIPGIYELKQTDTIAVLINLAHGFMPDADIKMVDLNEIIKNKKYHIPFKKSEVEKNYKYDLNSISYDELLSLGIKENRALEIIIYRKNKPFETLEELLNIKGIGEKTLEKIKDYFYIR
ncbi:Competence protein ComEA [Alteracholeplasma palmae J233]|uniref:Competence protein ComEA n=1 Tax=Alteracholeplasma palmae (strain ATCC 49389 / J233) TaxID=1318466 RepID=U4KKS6_ALTPJ|nr:helix-hairpin-helix domain-containing protein [Alteracholeplasma palmae]CCV64282.1 Competence protein ComEA [Alteracholeplasma palmae J233]